MAKPTWTLVLVAAAVALLVLETLVEYSASTAALAAAAAPPPALKESPATRGGGAPENPRREQQQPQQRRDRLSPSALLAETYALAPSTQPGGKRLEDLSAAEVAARKWFVFQPSGGFNNQRIILERALRICKITGRTCLVPPAGRHSSMYKNYNKLDADEVIAMDRVLDFAAIAAYQDAVPTAARFEDALEMMRGHFADEAHWRVVEQTRAERKKAPITFENITALAADPVRVVFFAGPTMWQRFAHAFDDEVHAHIRYAPFFRALSLDLAAGLGLGRNYVCVHSRPSDHGEKWEERRANASAAYAGEAYGDAAPSPPPTQKVRHANGFSTKYLHSDEAIADPGTYLHREIWLSIADAGLDPELFQRVYIATKPNIDQQVFANLTAAENVQVFLSADMPLRVAAALDAVFPRLEQLRLRNDILGIVEQLVCARAFVYIGFKGSSFSEYIARMRQEPVRNLIVGELGQIW